MDPIFSRRDAVVVEIEGRSYTLAPLTFRERQAFRADLTREGGIFPTQAQMTEAMRAALRDLAPGNLPELLAVLDAADAPDPDAATLARLAAVELACCDVPTYAAMLAARQRYFGLLPYVAARHALRGWSGEQLPPFRRERGLVPDDLMDLLPHSDIEIVGWRADSAMRPAAAAEKNSGAPSPSPETPAPSTGG